MSIKRNILANYASQMYVTAIGIGMVPLYLKYMGAEAYGLTGYVRYVGSGHHKRNPADYGLTRTSLRPTQSFCDLRMKWGLTPFPLRPNQDLTDLTAQVLVGMREVLQTVRGSDLGAHNLFRS